MNSTQDSSGRPDSGEAGERRASPAPHPVVARFVAACRADPRVVAAFVSGSHATGAADAHSDLDLGVITGDDALAAFLAEAEAFVGGLGDLLFFEDFGSAQTRFFVLADGTEGEVAVGAESRFSHVARGPYRVLLDETGVLDGATFVGQHPDPDDQREALRRLIVWFWHDLSHLITAIARGRLWWAYGQLEVLRRSCVNLARLRRDFADPDVGTECYYKVEQALPAEQLAPLLPAICPMEPAAMVEAARAVVRVYRALAIPLAAAHGLTYPQALERLMRERLDRLRPRS
jgi:hypothetical protein